MIARDMTRTSAQPAPDPALVMDRPASEDDALGLALATLRLSGARYCASRLASPWGISFAARACAMYHAVDNGSCWLRVEGEPPLAMDRGDVVVLPHGDAPALADAPDRPARRVDFHADRCGVQLRAGGQGPRTTLVCGELHMSGDHVGLFRGSLPRIIVVRAGDDPAIGGLLALLGGEVVAAGPASSAVVARLSELIFVQAIRRAVLEGTALPRGWLSGLADPEIGRALGAMHGAPAAPWTVEALARRARVSRSVFAERFRAAVGEPPLAYLTRWRMHVAWQGLRDHPERSTNEIAQSVGYESPAAFHRAFLRLTGRRPGEVRAATARA